MKINHLQSNRLFAMIAILCITVSTHIHTAYHHIWRIAPPRHRPTQVHIHTKTFYPCVKKINIRKRIKQRIITTSCGLRRTKNALASLLFAAACISSLLITQCSHTLCTTNTVSMHSTPHWHHGWHDPAPVCISAATCYSYCEEPDYYIEEPVCIETVEYIDEYIVPETPQISIGVHNPSVSVSIDW